MSLPREELPAVKTFVIRPLPHAATVLSLLGLAASNEDGGRDVEPVPVSWRPGEKRGPAPDPRAEVDRILRANRNFQKNQEVQR